MSNIVVDRPCTISESIARSCEEVKLIKKGKLPRKTWRDLKKELEEDASAVRSSSNT